MISSVCEPLVDPVKLPYGSVECFSLHLVVPASLPKKAATMHIPILILLCSSSFPIALIFTPLFLRFAERFGILDRPDSKRKIHTRAVPRIGGVPIFMAYIGSYAVLLLVHSRIGIADGASLSTARSLVPAALLVFSVGLADDIFGLKPLQKLLGQVVASILAVMGGIRIVGIDGFMFNPWIAAIGTVIWLIGCTNAVNLIDGVDGLASGIALLGTTTAGIAGLLNGDIGLALVTIPLAFALLGFLRYNLAPASIFLGDCGSLTVGFLLGCYGVLWSEKSATLLGMTAPLMALAVPLLDTALAIVRRYLRRQPIFGADRAHIHHRLLARGLTPRRVTLVLYAAAGCASVLSLLMLKYHNQVGGLIIVLFVAGAIFGIDRLGYAEFDVARASLLTGGFRPLLNTRLSIEACEERIMAAMTPDECWSAIEAASRNFGFSVVELKLAGRTFAYQEIVRPSQSWQIHVPISDVDFLNFTRPFSNDNHTNIVEPFIDTLRRALVAKLPFFIRFLLPRIGQERSRPPQLRPVERSSRFEMI